MIPARYQQQVFVFFMTLLMGLVLSFVFELQAGNYQVQNAATFLSAWLLRFLGTYIIVLPVVVLVNPVAARLSALVVAQDPDEAAARPISIGKTANAADGDQDR